MEVTRRLAAIMFTDIKDFTKRMNARESLGLRLLEKHNEIMDGALRRHHGTFVKNIGDAYLVEFGSAVNAVEAAVDAQGLFARLNAEVGSAEEILVRISIHLGDVLIQDGDLFGDGVNIASRLQSITPPGGICISGDVYTHVRGKVDAECSSIGRHELKGVAEPVEVFQVMTALVPIRVENTGAKAHAETPAEAPSEAPARIAVLPFANWSEAKENEYFSDGITEDIITDLAKIGGLQVSSRNSVFSYKGRNVDPKTAGAELGVRYLLEGSVRRSGSRLRITAQLIDAQGGAHLWAERFDRDMTDIFAIQDEIARHIAGELRVRLTKDQERALQDRGTRSLEAYDLYLKGLFHGRKRTRADLDRAEEHLRAALLIDPGFARAHTWLAWTLRFKFGFGMDRDPGVLKGAKGHTEQALALDPGLPDAVLMKGLILREDGHMAEAIATLQELVRRHPSHSQGHAYLGNACQDVGMFSLAIQHHTRAMELDPRYFIYPYNLAEDLIALGQGIPELAPMVERAAALPDRHFLVMWYQALVAAANGNGAEADRLIGEMMRADPGHTPPTMLHGMYLVMRGRAEEAYPDFSREAQRAPGEPIVVHTCVPALAALRRFDEASRLIDAALGNWKRRFLKGVDLPTMALWYQGLIRRSRGEEAGARESFRLARDRAAEILGDFPEAVLMRAMYSVLLAACGDADKALQESERVHREHPEFVRNAYYRAVVCSLLHDKPALLDWLRTLVSRGTIILWGLKNDLAFEEFAADSEFLQIVDRSVLLGVH